MNDRQVDQAIQEIERALVADDPEFARHVRATQRKDVINVVAVFVLLAVGAVLWRSGWRRPLSCHGRSVRRP